MKREIWNKELIISKIINIKEQGEPLFASHVMSNNSKLYGAARKHFGSWENAITEAGLDYKEINLRAKENKWSKDKVKNEILQLHQQGVCLNSEYIQKNHTKLHSAAQRYFTSWGDAISYSGLNYEDIKDIKWTKDSIIAEILSLYELNEDLSSSAMQRNNMALFQAGCRIFNSWKEAVVAAGLSYDDFRKQKEWTKTTVLVEIRKFVQENNCSSAGVISKKYGSLYQAGRRLYKNLSWKDIVALALEENTTNN